MLSSWIYSTFSYTYIVCRSPNHTLPRMPILDGYQATERIRSLEKSTNAADNLRLSNRLNGGHIPIFAVSASLREHRREELANYGIDGWILKPIDFKRLKVILKGVTDPAQRALDLYHPGCSWEARGPARSFSLTPFFRFNSILFTSDGPGFRHFYISASHFVQTDWRPIMSRFTDRYYLYIYPPQHVVLCSFRKLETRKVLLAGCTCA
jgi:CheY-like chemotaxis protein